MEKDYEAKSICGETVVGKLGYQTTFWGIEEPVLIGLRGEIFQIDPNTLKVKKKRRSKDL